MADTTKKLGLKVVMAGLASYKAGVGQVTGGNSMVKQSIMNVVNVGQRMTAGTIAIGSALGNLATGAVQLAIKGLKSLVSEIKKTVVESSRVAGLKVAFEGLTASMGRSAQEVLQAFKAATGGMSPMRDAMLQFNQAASLISADFALMLPDAMRSLGKVSRATGSDIKYLMNSLVLGVGRLSPMILDNLQIQASLSEATARATEMFGLQKDQLTKTQKQLGMANVVIEKLNRNTAHMPDIAGSAAASMGSLGAVIQDTRDLIGMEFLPLYTKFAGALNKTATQILPKLVPIAHEVSGALQRIVAWVEKLIPVERIINALKAAFVELKVGIAEGMSNNLEIWKNWVNLIAVRGESIARLIFDRILPAFESLSDVIANVFYNRLTPAIIKAGQYLTYFFRTFDKVLTGVRMLLEGRKDDAKEMFADAWQTALAVVITILKNATDAVVGWGRKLVQSYATGIVEGIRAYLSAALKAVASYLRSFMAPGSPPKFLPDIGTWGAETMNEYLKGFGEADYGMLAQFTGQFKAELGKMVQAGILDRDAFAGAFFELRGHLTKVISQFKETGVIAEDSLDVIRKRLGMTGTGMAELIKLNLQYQAVEENLLKLQEEGMELQKQAMELQKQEQEIADAARRAYEAGEIGAEEYEDIIKAVRDRKEEEEAALNAQAEALQEQMSAEEARAKEMADQIALLQAQMGFHQETRDIYAEQESLLKQIKEAVGGIGKAAEEAGETLTEALSDIEIDAPDLFEDLSDAWEMEGGPKLDFGELLPDVEEMKNNVEAFFNGILGRAQKAIMSHPIVKTIASFVEKEIIPRLAQSFFWLKDVGIPGAIAKFNEFKQVALETYTAISGKVSSFLEWFGIINRYIQEQGGWWQWLASYLIIWWEMQVKPALQPFIDWWNETWPIVQAVFLTVWTIISGVVSAAVKTIVDVAWPALQEAFETLKKTLEESGISWGTLLELLGMAAKLISTVLLVAIVTFGGIVTGVITGVAKAISTWAIGFRQIIQGVAQIWIGLSETFSGVWDTISAILEGDWPAALEGLKRALAGFNTFFRGIWTLIKGFLRTTFGTILSFVGGFVTGLWQYFVNLYESLIGEEGIVKKTWDDIWTNITSIADSIITWFEEKWQSFVDIGQNIVGGIVAGLEAAWGAIKTKLTELAGGLPEWVKKPLGIKSDSKVFAQIGRNIGGGLLSGIEEMIPRIQRQISLQIAPAMVQPIGRTGPNVTSIDQSRHSNRSIIMPVTLIGNQNDLARFKTTLRDVLNERG